MNLSSSFHLLRTCAASSSRRATRPGLRALQGRVTQPRRCYSDDKASGSSQAAEEKPQEASEKKDATTELEAKLKEKEAEVTDLKGRLQYLQADFINLQRNAAREKDQAKDFSITRFAKDLLETVDVLSLALKSVPHTALSESQTPPEKPHSAYLKDLHTGVDMTQRMLLQTLAKYHVKPFDPTGEKFDPNEHEALYQAPIPGKEPGTVIDTQKIGYKIKDRVLRAAQVGVAQDTS